MTSKRTKDDICLLCKSEKAIKKNSHIISKFLGKEMLGGKGRRRGFETKIDKGEFINRKIIQDTPKEDFLFCEECEKKFGVVETIVSNKLKYLRSHFMRKKHFGEKAIRGVKYLEIIDFDSRVFHLFIYSQIWRMSVSCISFEKFFLNNEEEEILNDILNTYLKSTKSELAQLLSNKSKEEFNYVRYIISTPNKIKDHKLNGIFCIMPTNNEKHYIFSIGEYHVNFYFEKLEFGGVDFDTIPERILLNNDGENVKIQVVDEKLWNNVLIERRRNLDRISNEKRR